MRKVLAWYGAKVDVATYAAMMLALLVKAALLRHCYIDITTLITYCYAAG